MTLEEEAGANAILGTNAFFIVQSMLRTMFCNGFNGCSVTTAIVE